MQSALMRAAVGAILVLSVSAVTACSDDDDPTGPDDVTKQIVGSIQSDAHIMGMLHESHASEVAVGQLALERTSDLEVRAFATAMITEHSTLDAEDFLLAARLGIMPALPDTRLTDLQDDERRRLAGLAGAAFDRGYIAQQITAHMRTLEIVGASIAQTRQTELRASLNGLQPRVAAHLAKAQQIGARIGSP